MMKPGCDRTAVAFILRQQDQIRDEIRLIGPGLYLGNVYWSKTHIFDFALQF
jgi:hypothetical protein